MCLLPRAQRKLVEEEQRTLPSGVSRKSSTVWILTCKLGWQIQTEEDACLMGGQREHSTI